jgi:mannitol 2-dehydrogenase
MLPRHAARVSVPRYDRGGLRRGVVHIGVGSFHRAHQAVYFDALARRGLGDGWALTGVGLHRRDMKNALSAQDGLYTVLSRDTHGNQARVVGIITRYLFAPDKTQAVLATLVDETTRLVTLTITANGYGPDPRSWPFAANAPKPSLPSATELLVEALARRRRCGQSPFTILSCDNLVNNGAVARAAVLRTAADRDERLATWIDKHVAFPSSMVDRITPGTTAADRRLLEREFGVRDRWPVVTEPFSQWIIEDSFSNGRPPLQEVGARFVTDVQPYALMKTRLLNGTHSALGYLGSLAGHHRIDQAVADPVFGAYTERLMTDEIAPLLPRTAVDLRGYCEILQSRFANPAVGDPLSRLCRNGSSKVPAHLLSSIRDARAVGRPHPMLTLAVAAWCQHLRGYEPLEDAGGARLRALARRGGDDPRPLLNDEQTFGSLSRCRRLAEAVQRDLQDLDKADPRAVIAARLSGSDALPEPAAQAA